LQSNSPQLGAGAPAGGTHSCARNIVACSTRKQSLSSIWLATYGKEAPWGGKSSAHRRLENQRSAARGRGRAWQCTGITWRRSTATRG
jgi:hypothetical protein